MPHPLALLALSGSSPDMAGLATASLAAYLHTIAPQIEAKVLRIPESGRSAGEADLEAFEPAAAFWWTSPEAAWPAAPLARVRALLPRSMMVAGGPAIPTEQHARDFLQAHPAFDAALAGEAEAGVAGLALAGPRRAGRIPLDTIPGLVFRRRNTFVSGPPSRLLQAEELPSPFAQNALNLSPRPGEHRCLEVFRGDIPFSPLSPALPRGMLRLLPLGRLRGDLAILFDGDVASIRLISGPLDLVPDFLQDLLELIGELNHRTLVSLELSAPPPLVLVERMRAAGVGRIHLDLPESDPFGMGDPSGHRRRLKTVTDLGIQVALRIPLGSTDASEEAVKRRIEQGLALHPHQITVTAASFWPGRPLEDLEGRMRDAPGGSVGHGWKIAGFPGYEVLATPSLSHRELRGIVRSFEVVEGFLRTVPQALRLLARSCDLPVQGVLSRLVDYGPAVAAATPEGTLSRSGRTALVTVARQLLQEAGKGDRLPLLTTLVDYESWVTASKPLPPFPREIPYDPDELGPYILARVPGLEMRTFLHDVTRFGFDMDLDNAPMHRTHLALKRHGAWPSSVQVINDFEMGLLQSIDGVRPVAVLLDGPRRSARAQGGDSAEPKSALGSLIEKGLLYVRGMARLSGTGYQRIGRDNVLSFPIRTVDFRRSRRDRGLPEGTDSETLSVASEDEKRSGHPSADDPPREVSRRQGDISVDLQGTDASPRRSQPESPSPHAFRDTSKDEPDS